MEPLLIAVGSSAPDIFALCFLLAVTLATLIVWLTGRRQGEEMVAWSVLLAATWLGWLVGSRLYAAFPSLVDHLAGGEFLLGHGKSLLGGIAGAILAVLITRPALRTDSRYADAWALALPAALLAGRLGCLLAGCCHGTPTDMPWAIAYPAGSLAHIHQVNDGLVSRWAAQTLPLHPAQLYEMVGVAGLLALAILLRRRVTGRGTRFLLVVAGYALLRFAQEFVRYGGDGWLGLKWVQWGMAASALLFFFWAWRRVRLGDYAGGRASTSPIPTRAGRATARTACVLCGALVAALAASWWLTPLERAALLIGGAPAVAHGAAWLGHALAGRLGIGLRLAPTAAAAVALASWSPLGLRGERPRTDQSSFLVELSGGGGQITYQEICDDTRYRDRFYDVRLRLANRWKYRLGEVLEGGVVGWAGRVQRLNGPVEGEGPDPELHWIPTLQGALPAPYYMAGVQPYLLWDFYWGAVGAGAHLFAATEGRGPIGVMGSGYLRAGPEDIAFLEGGFCWPGAPLGGAVYRAGLGTTLGPVGTLRAGLLAVPGRGSIYIEPTFHLDLEGRRLLLTPYGAIDPDGEYFHFGATVGLEVPLTP